MRIIITIITTIILHIIRIEIVVNIEIMTIIIIFKISLQREQLKKKKKEKGENLANTNAMYSREIKNKFSGIPLSLNT